MKVINVTDLMQQQYSYSLVENEGENFHPDFRPELTPAEMLELGRRSGKTIAEMKFANEAVHGDPIASIDTVRDAMFDCIDRGLRMDGELPGGLSVRRRAKAIFQSLEAERGMNLAQPHVANDWLSVYAMAVNEENAAGGRVVTAPTNGAAGIIPAVLSYYDDFIPDSNEDGIIYRIVEGEGAPHARFAFDPDLTVHQLDQLPADGQAEPGSASAAFFGRVKRIENVLQIFSVDAFAIVSNGHFDVVANPHRLIPHHRFGKPAVFGADTDNAVVADRLQSVAD